MTSDLVAFLRERLDEDESEAKAAIDRAGSGDWRYRPDADYVSWVETDEDATAAINREVWWPLVTEAQSYVGDGIHDELGRHIARHDPARVLRDVEAKRRMMDEILRYESGIDGEFGCCHSGAQIAAGQCPEINPDGIVALRVLALPYADHPEYRKEWRP